MANPIKRKKMGSIPIPEDWIANMIRRFMSALKGLFSNIIISTKTTGIEDVFTGQRTFGASEINPIAPPNPNRNRITIKNHGTGVIYIGTYQVSTSNGYKLSATAGDNVLVLENSWGAIYGAADSTGCTISFIEE